MNITINTKEKTIKVEEQVNFCELHDELTKMLGETLKDYRVLAFEKRIEFQPTYIPQTSPYTIPCSPYTHPFTGAPNDYPWRPNWYITTGSEIGMAGGGTLGQQTDLYLNIRAIN